MWFRYVVMLVFVIDAVFAFLEAFGKAPKKSTKTGLLWTGFFYIAMAVLVFEFIR